MQQHIKVPIDNVDDDDGDDDEDDLKQEISDTIEKFVQNRHVQTLKYLRHVIDENRHLRLHIEHLKRRQENPLQSPAVVDPRDPEDTPLSEIPPEPPEPILDLEHFDASTNTEGDDFEKKYLELKDELINLKKQNAINRDEFQRELERVDRQNTLLEKDLKASQNQLFNVQKALNDKQIEIQNLTSKLEEQNMMFEAANIRINKLEHANRTLIQSLGETEQIRDDFESQLEELQRLYEETKTSLSTLKIECTNKQMYLNTIENELTLLKDQFNEKSNKCEELTNDNTELKSNICYLQQTLQEKIVQEEKLIREKQENSNFKEFIQIKRTLQTCQQENEQLKLELKKLHIKLLNKQE